MLRAPDGRGLGAWKKTKKIRKTPENVLCNDTPTKYAHLGWRFLCALLSWFLLGMSISEGSAFFASLSLFIVPLMLDYYKYEPNGRIRKVITYLAKLVNGLFLVIGVIGMFGVLNIINMNDVLVIKTTKSFVFPDLYIIDVQCFWSFLLLPVSICAVDWALNITSLETDIVGE